MTDRPAFTSNQTFFFPYLPSIFSTTDDRRTFGRNFSATASQATGAYHSLDPSIPQATPHCAWTNTGYLGSGPSQPWLLGP